MGELFSHFEGWDVQAIRKEAREEARKEAQEQGIKVLIEVLKETGNSKEIARQQLMKQYSLEEYLADEKIKLYWKE